MNNGGGRSNNNMFSAFDFCNDEELQVEAHAREAVAKFGIQSPSKKSVRRRKSIDKYDFLMCCKSKTRAITFKNLISLLEAIASFFTGENCISISKLKDYNELHLFQQHFVTQSTTLMCYYVFD